jgi:hypothetical protein
MKMRVAAWPVIFVSVLLISSGPAFGQKADTLAGGRPGHLRKLNPTGALLRSAIIPGWGQFYNHSYIKATIIASGESYLIYGVYNYWKDANRHQHNFENSSDPVYKASEFNKYSSSRDQRNIRLWILAATVFYSMFDAYVDAQLSDFNQTDKAFQVFVAPTQDAGMQVVMNFNIK